MELIIDGYLIDEPIINILYKCKSELTNGKLSSIIDKGSWVSVTCPFHSDGKERNNSCGIVSISNSSLEYGTFNCFTCKHTGNLYHFIGACFDLGDAYGKKWLISNFGKPLYDRQIKLDRIVLNQNKAKIKGDETILETFQSYHPYMTKRKLSKDVIENFKIKYDPKTESIIFPVWDEYGKYLFYTSRNVNYKGFNIPKDVDKPIYLLNFVLQQNINKVIVCESQINTLTCWSYGYPAIGLFGSSLTNYQQKILNRSGIRTYILALDGDEAGQNGIAKFKEKIRKDVIVEVVWLPQGKDINDLTKEEFELLFKKYY